MVIDLQKCRSAKKLSENEIIERLMTISSKWIFCEDKLSRTFFVGGKKRDGFSKAFSLAQNIANICEEYCHHPELIINWGSCEVRLWTCSVCGLSNSDFEIAKRIDDRLSDKDKTESSNKPLYHYPTSFNEARKMKRRYSLSTR